MRCAYLLYGRGLYLVFAAIVVGPVDSRCASFKEHLAPKRERKAAAEQRAGFIVHVAFIFSSIVLSWNTVTRHIFELLSSSPVRMSVSPRFSGFKSRQWRFC